MFFIRDLSAWQDFPATLANGASPDFPVPQDPWVFPVVPVRWDRKDCPVLLAPEAKPDLAVSAGKPAPSDLLELLVCPASKDTKANRAPTANLLVNSATVKWTVSYVKISTGSARRKGRSRPSWSRRSTCKLKFFLPCC